MKKEKARKKAEEEGSVGRAEWEDREGGRRRRRIFRSRLLGKKGGKVRSGRKGGT